jgi:hypothetical protein
MEVLAFSGRAINCYLACGFRQEPVGRGSAGKPACTRTAGKDVIVMAVLQAEHAAQRAVPDSAGSA